MRWGVLLAVLGLMASGAAACGPAGPAGPTPVPAGTTTPATAVAVRAVTFAASDGAPLSGRLFGTGSTTVVLSNMGDNDPGPWEGFAPLLVAKGYAVLTYSFRYPAYTSQFTPTMAVQTVPDLRGAVAFARQQGARRIVLIGASLGGITVGKLAVETHATSVVIMAAEQNLVGYGLAVTPAELAAMTQPKLFVASTDDTNTPYAETKSFYDNAPGPKQFHAFPGDTHGVHLFDTARGDELRNLLVSFVTATAPV